MSEARKIKEPILVGEILDGSPERKIYAYRKYKVCPSGIHKATGKKEDVTTQIAETASQCMTCWWKG